jgi:hypothetical protein
VNTHTPRLTLRELEALCREAPHLAILYYKTELWHWFESAAANLMAASNADSDATINIQVIIDLIWLSEILKRGSYPRITLHLYSHSGRIAEPWREAGYTPILIDSGFSEHRLETPRDEAYPNLYKFSLSTENINLLPLHQQLPFISAEPPCDKLSRAGARHWRDEKEGTFQKHASRLAETINFCRENSLTSYIEQPIIRGVYKSKTTPHPMIPEPTDKVEPHQFAMLSDDPPAESYTKRTWLWLEGFSLVTRGPTVHPVEVNRTTRIRGGSNKRARSLMPQGLSRAVNIDAIKSIMTEAEPPPTPSWYNPALEDPTK